MPLYRCMCCVNPDRETPGKDFEADKPVCPDCGADQGDVVKLETIHFDPPKRLGRGLNHAACNPALKVGRAANTFFTGERDAVTCVACKKSKAFADAPAAEGMTFKGKITPEK